MRTFDSPLTALGVLFFVAGLAVVAVGPGALVPSLTASGPGGTPTAGGSQAAADETPTPDRTPPPGRTGGDDGSVDGANQVDTSHDHGGSGEGEAEAGGNVRDEGHEKEESSEGHEKEESNEGHDEKEEKEKEKKKDESGDNP